MVSFTARSQWCCIIGYWLYHLIRNEGVEGILLFHNGQLLPKNDKMEEWVKFVQFSVFGYNSKTMHLK